MIFFEIRIFTRSYKAHQIFQLSAKVIERKNRKEKRKKRKRHGRKDDCQIENGTVINFGNQYFITCQANFCLESQNTHGSFQCAKGEIQENGFKIKRIIRREFPKNVLDLFCVKTVKIMNFFY